MNTLFYFDLEPVKNRYTEQLSNDWMPSSLEFNCPKNFQIKKISGKASNTPIQINVGQVLDTSGRSIYSLEQCIEFINLIREGKVKSGDVLYFQDFWTPGIESIFYTLDMYNISVRSYAMLHAQSVDEYDFTYKMRDWMRPFELGIDKRMNGIFVGSQIHKEQLRQAGFNAPIYIVSLPFGRTIERRKLKAQYPNTFLENIEKKNQVVFTSRFDREKNISFMLTVAEKFLERYNDWEWILTTGAEDIRSNDDFLKQSILDLEKRNSRFKIIRNISKEDYYKTLLESKIQFNSSLQDYVSWTLIEATTFGCYPIYPNFRSFTEIIEPIELYEPFFIDSALEKLDNIALQPWRFDSLNFSNSNFNYISEISEYGLLIESYIMFNDWKEHEINVWLEKEYVRGKWGTMREKYIEKMKKRITN